MGIPPALWLLAGGVDGVDEGSDALSCICESSPSSDCKRMKWRGGSGGEGNPSAWTYCGCWRGVVGSLELTVVG